MNKTKTIIISKKISYSFFKERLNKLVNIDKKFTSDDFIYYTNKIYGIQRHHINIIKYYLLPFNIYISTISEENRLIVFSFRGIKYTYNMETNHLKK
jgi:hypothetical protein